MERDILAATRRANALGDAPPGSVPQSEIEEVFAEVRRVSAEAPLEDEDCEVTPQVEEEIEKMGN